MLNINIYKNNNHPLKQLRRLSIPLQISSRKLNNHVKGSFYLKHCIRHQLCTVQMLNIYIQKEKLTFYPIETFCLHLVVRCND